MIIYMGISLTKPKGSQRKANRFHPGYIGDVIK